MTAFDSFWLPPGLSSSQELRSACFFNEGFPKQPSCAPEMNLVREHDEDIKHVWSSFIRFESIYYVKLKIYLSKLRSHSIRIIFIILLHHIASRPVARYLGFTRVLRKNHLSFYEMFPNLHSNWEQNVATQNQTFPFNTEKHVYDSHLPWAVIQI